MTNLCDGPAPMYIVKVAFSVALSLSLAREAPWLASGEALRHSMAAIGAQTSDVPAEVLLAIAWRESRFSEAARPQCGVLQTSLRGLRCRRLIADGVGAEYRFAARGDDQLGEWFASCRSGRRARGVSISRCALNGYAEGGAAARRGWGVRGCGGARCDRSASVLARARRLRGRIVGEQE